MKRRSANLSFTLRLRATLLHKLLQAVATRAYELGHADGAQQKAPDVQRVDIDPALLRKFL